MPPLQTSRSVQPPDHWATKIALHDIVELASGHRLIVTEIKASRPANPYSGVLENGRGAEYKFGPKHGPRVVGQVESDHPALLARAERASRRQGRDDRQLANPQPAAGRALLRNLARAVLEGRTELARILAEMALEDAS